MGLERINHANTSFARRGTTVIKFDKPWLLREQTKPRIERVDVPPDGNVTYARGKATGHTARSHG